MQEDAETSPESRVHRANMGLTWGWQDPGGPHVGCMNFAIWVYLPCAAVITWSVFFQNHHKRDPIARLVRASYEVSFVGSNSHLYSDSVTAVICAISCYIGKRYNGTRTVFRFCLFHNFMNKHIYIRHESNSDQNKTISVVKKREKLHWLTHWGQDKMDPILQTTFSSAFSWMKIYEFRLRFHWSLFIRVQLTIFQHWFI